MAKNVSTEVETQMELWERSETVTPIQDIDGLPPIVVAGVGGGGCNAVNRMVQATIRGERKMSGAK